MLVGSLLVFKYNDDELGFGWYLLFDDVEMIVIGIVVVLCENDDLVLFVAPLVALLAVVCDDDTVDVIRSRSLNTCREVICLRMAAPLSV